jgi:hypothetical protein
MQRQQMLANLHTKTNISGLCAEMQPTVLSVMIMGEVIHNIALFVQF